MSMHSRRKRNIEIDAIRSSDRNTIALEAEKSKVCSDAFAERCRTWEIALIKARWSRIPDKAWQSI